jgi:hypothetical protein
MTKFVYPVIIVISFLANVKMYVVFSPVLKYI